MKLPQDTFASPTSHMYLLPIHYLSELWLTNSEPQKLTGYDCLERVNDSSSSAGSAFWEEDSCLALEHLWAASLSAAECQTCSAWKTGWDTLAGRAAKILISWEEREKCCLQSTYNPGFVSGHSLIIMQGCSWQAVWHRKWIILLGNRIVSAEVNQYLTTT